MEAKRLDELANQLASNVAETKGVKASSDVRGLINELAKKGAAAADAEIRSVFRHYAGPAAPSFAPGGKLERVIEKAIARELNTQFRGV